MIPHLRLIFLAMMTFLLSCAVEIGPPPEEMAPDYKPSGDPALYTPRPPVRRDVAIVDLPTPPDTGGKVWVAGYWARSGWSWSWVPGRWVPLPRPGSVRVAERICRPWGIN
jgi:hypothetical protein